MHLRRNVILFALLALLLVTVESLARKSPHFHHKRGKHPNSPENKHPHNSTHPTHPTQPPAQPPTQPTPSPPPAPPPPPPPIHPNDTCSVNGKFASDYYVDGQNVPGVGFPVADSYAGLMSASEDHQKQMFFWYYPCETDVGKDDLVIWIQGGNCCSGIQGALQYLGPWILPLDSDGTPVANNYSWTTIANMIFVDYPIGTGFSTGPTAVGSNSSAHDMFVWLNNFLEVFPEMAGKRLWFAGEGTAGKFIDYILEELFLAQADFYSNQTAINYAGFLHFSPFTTGYIYSQEMPAPDFAFKYKDTLGLNDSFIATLKQEADAHNVTDIISKNLLYPAPANFTLSNDQSGDFDPYGLVINATELANPCFAIYNAYDKKCHTDPLGFPPQQIIPDQNNWVNNHSDFKSYIHVDPSQKWQACTLVFGRDGDNDSMPDDTFLGGQLFDLSPYSNVIVSSEYAASVLADGIALNLQFLAWGEGDELQQGFTNPPTTPFKAGGEQVGGYTSERNLTFIRIDAPGVGVQVAMDHPLTGFTILQYLLGQNNQTGSP